MIQRRSPLVLGRRFLSDLHEVLSRGVGIEVGTGRKRRIGWVFARENVVDYFFRQIPRTQYGRDNAFLVDHNGVRNAERRVGPKNRDLRIKRDPGVDRVLLQKVLHLWGILVPDGNELDRFVLVLCNQIIGPGEIRDTRRAPGSPEIEDHDFSSKRLPIDRARRRALKDRIKIERRRLSAGFQGIRRNLFQSLTPGWNNRQERESTESKSAERRHDVVRDD